MDLAALFCYPDAGRHLLSLNPTEPLPLGGKLKDAPGSVAYAAMISQTEAENGRSLYPCRRTDRVASIFGYRIFVGVQEFTQRLQRILRAGDIVDIQKNVIDRPVAAFFIIQIGDPFEHARASQSDAKLIVAGLSGEMLFCR